VKIFVLNRGSSSIKCDVYEFVNLPHKPIQPLWKARLQWKNSFEEATLKIKNDKGEEYVEKIRERSAGQALPYLIKFLVEGKVAILTSLKEIEMIGHRIVHGGREFKKSVPIDTKVKEKILQLSELAPLHNLPELQGIEILEKFFRGVPQVAVFDTAFHHSLPKKAAIYPGPYEWYEQGIQRYGFHGISFQYCAKRAGEILKQDLRSRKTVICHLGSGASLCAVKEGKSVDTTMGFTPLEGLMMDTRSGSIDPGIILYLQDKKKKSSKEVAHELYKKSGLFGVSGASSDMRDILEKSERGNPRATLALDIYIHRLNACIGSMIASLQGLDVLIFAAGIGENASFIREKVCENFSFLDLKLDRAKNQLSSTKDRDLSARGSKVKLLVIHTEEAFEIARECWEEWTNAKDK